EAEVGADVREPGGEGARGPAHPRGRVEHRLVGEVDRDLGAVEAVHERYSVLGRAAQLLRAADEDRPDPFVRQRREGLAHDRGRVLAVDECDRLHRRAVTSVAIRSVYFSYSSVSRSNWMIRSWPWNGYRRQTATWVPLTSITL